MGFISLNQLPLETDDFVFTSLDARVIMDAMVIVHPKNCFVISPVFLRSRKTLDEEIEHINQNNVKKLIVVAEDIEFLKRCPGIEYLWVLPAISANDFDYSPIYELPNLKWLSCRTIYGKDEDKVADLDYSRLSNLSNLKRVYIEGSKGHQNITALQELVALSFDFGYPKSKTLQNTFFAPKLINFTVNQAPILSLDGIENAPNLKRLELSYDRSLTDISALSHLSESLGYLEIDTCGKIKDFSVLSKLHNLEVLKLLGSNELQNLSFLKDMPKLKYVHITMNVVNGDLSLCEHLPYVRVKNRKHYSHKDKDLPKKVIDPDQLYPDRIV